MDNLNQQVAEQLIFMGQLLEINNEDSFKVRAYYRAAEQINRLNRSVKELDEKGLIQIEGIGKNIAKKIQDIVKTGSFPELEELKSKIPSTLIELLELEGVGPKTISKLWKQMSIQTIDDLEKAARNHRLRTLKGFGERKEHDILKSIAANRQKGQRMNRMEADKVVQRLSSVIAPSSFDVAGSYRRGKSTIGDIDLMTIASPASLNQKLRSVADEVIDEGDRRSSIRCLGQRVDIRFTKPKEYGTMLVYLTGSKDFNIKLREIAVTKGFKLNEYGIEERSTNTFHTFEREEDVFTFLSMAYIPPELRENWGEIEMAMNHNLPNFIKKSDIRGDLHVHSSWSDGHLSIEELSQIGEKLRYDYLLCSDHSATLGIAHGLNPGTLQKQVKEIEQINRRFSCQILSGIEVDILGDGTIGLPNQILRDLDIVIASIHSGFKQDSDIITRRILSAIENDNVDIIGHPTGRLIGQREAYDVDMTPIIKAASDTRTVLEINASPYRLDLDDIAIKEARDNNVKLSIGTDAHDESEFANIVYGIMVARRGWCRSFDVLNTSPIEELMEFIS